MVLNQREALPRTMRSVRAQRGVSLEHVIVDGGSTDGTLDVVRGEATQNVWFVSEPDHGIYDAINKGIALARGRYVGLLHAGTTYCEDSALAELWTAARSSGADVVYADYVRLEHDWKVALRVHTSLDLAADMTLGHEAMLVSRSAYARYGLYDPSFALAADYAFLIRLLACGASFVHVPRPAVVFESGGASHRAYIRTPLEGFSILLRDVGALPAMRYAATQARRLLMRFGTAAVASTLGGNQAHRLVRAYFTLRKQLDPSVELCEDVGVITAHLWRNTAPKHTPDASHRMS